MRPKHHKILPWPLGNREIEIASYWVGGDACARNRVHSICEGLSIIHDVEMMGKNGQLGNFAR